MFRRKIIGIILVLVFMIPVLPIWQVGLLLFTNAITEEIEHSPGENDAPVKLTEKEIHFYNLNTAVLESRINAFRNRNMDEKFLSRQADDVQTPPPNM